MRVFTCVLICLWIVGLLIGCSNADFSMSNGNPPVTIGTCENTNSCPEPIDGYTFHNDSFVAPGGNTKVDILFVVDNSPSMVTEQNRLALGFDGFMNVMTDFSFNYQIAFTTTDMSGTGPTQDGKLLQITGTNSYVLRWEDEAQRSSHIDLFKATVRRSEVGSGDERGIYAAIKAFQRREHNFIRSDADLALIIVSDEDERSRGRKNLSDRLQSGRDYPDDLINKVNQIKNSDTAFTAHAIIIKEEDQECLDAQSRQGADATPYEGKVYAELARETNGEIGSVCETDYTKQLAQISRTLINETSSVNMKCVPDITPSEGRDVQVVLPQAYIDAGGEATVEGHQILFNPALLQGTSISYSYWCPNS